jgi:hypothetical protein
MKYLDLTSSLTFPVDAFTVGLGNLKVNITLRFLGVGRVELYPKSEMINDSLVLHRCGILCLT